MFNFGDEKVILRHKGKEYSWHDLKKIFLPRTAFLKKADCNNLLLICEDNFEFIINFLAGIFAQKELFLLTDKTKTYLLKDDFITEIGNCEDNIVLPEVNPLDIYINFFTSGTSSEPKKVRKTLQNLCCEAKDIYEVFPVAKNMSVVTTTKLTHMFGMTFAFIYPLLNDLVIDADTIKFPEQIQERHIVFVSTPSFLDKMAKYDNNPYPPEYIFSAGDRLKDETFAYFEQNSKVIDIYGSTESGTIAYSNNYIENAFMPLPNVDVSTDEYNQICVKSNYFMDDVLTLNDVIEKKGNKFKILQRSDRILKIQEKRISAVELEEHLNQHKFIDTSYCFKYKEKATAAVVLNLEGKKELLKAGSIEFIKQLKIYMRQFSEIYPQKWRFLYEIPKTETGKTDKKAIEKIFELNLSMPLVFDKKEDTHQVELTISFLRNSNFFQGHFPEIPILPGVVQLFFAHFFAEDSFGKISGSKIKKIKFSKIIKPDTIVKLKLKDNDLSVDYTYTDGENIFSSGTFIK